MIGFIISRFNPKYNVKSRFKKNIAGVMRRFAKKQDLKRKGEIGFLHLPEKIFDKVYVLTIKRLGKNFKNRFQHNLICHRSIGSESVMVWLLLLLPFGYKKGINLN